MAGTFMPLMAEKALAKPRTDFLDEIRRLQASVTAVADCRKPVIAAIQGWCIGGGVDLIAAADIRYASSEAKFSVREAKVAIVADIGSLHRLPPIIGDGHLRELAFTGKDIDAARAEKIGLVNDVFDTPKRRWPPRMPPRPRSRRIPAGGAGCQGRPGARARERRGRRPQVRLHLECRVPAVGGSAGSHRRGLREAGTRLQGALGTVAAPVHGILQGRPVRQPNRSRSGRSANSRTGPTHNQAIGRICAGASISSARNCSS